MCVRVMCGSCTSGLRCVCVCCVCLEGAHTHWEIIRAVPVLTLIVQAAVFMCDALPDVAYFAHYDNVSSAAQFFELPPPPGASL